ncbi:AMP-binding protein, partial [Vibrio parahaemolyticus]
MLYHPSHHAARNPDKPAIIMGISGEVVTYGELDAASNRFAQLLRARELGIGDTIALCFDNNPVFFALC